MTELEIARKALKKIARGTSLGKVNGETVWPWYVQVAKTALAELENFERAYTVYIRLNGRLVLVETYNTRIFNIEALDHYQRMQWARDKINHGRGTLHVQPDDSILVEWSS